MRTVLVTGASGFVGANVARVLLERGNRVRVFMRPNSDFGNVASLDVEKCFGDLCDFNSVSEAVKGCDDIYHVAAEYRLWSLKPETMYRNNVNGTRNVMEASLKHGVRRVIYTSTVGTIGMAALPRACDETTPLAKDQMSNHYKRSKFEAEKVALGYAERGLPLVVVNPSTPIGPWDRKPTPTGKIIVDFVQGKIPVYLETGLNIVHVRDVAVGHVLAAEKGKVGERYILGHQNMSLGEILGHLSELTGRSKPKFRIPYRAAWLAGLASTKVSDWITHRPPLVALDAVKMARKHMYFDSAKAVRDLGFPQTPVKKAFAEAVDWFSTQNYFNYKH